ncbi:MAG: universal stress protein, partial [Caldilineaceae bacterium]
VVIPLDGSEFSRQILRSVKNFFEPDDVELVLFRAAYPPVLPSEATPADMFAGAMPMAGSYEVYSRAVDATYSALEKERDQFRMRLADEIQPDVERLREAGYVVRAHVEYGEPAQSIIDFVNDTHADLVAMATHGRGGLGRLVLGSVAERVLRSVAVPVLLMRPSAVAAERPSAGHQLVRTLGRGNPLRLAAATDGSPGSQHSLAVAAQLANTLGVSLTVMVLATERDGVAHASAVITTARETVGTHKVKPNCVPLVGYTDAILPEFLEKSPQDLLVLGPFGDRSAGTQSAIGPTTQRVVQQAGCSVLVVKGHRKEFHRVLICADVDDEAAVTVGAQFAALHNASVDLVHVISPKAATYLAPGQGSDLALEEALAQGTRLSTVLQGWIDRFTGEGFERTALHLRRGNMPETALELSHGGNYDLVVVGSRSSPGHFAGSTANSLVRYAPCSVLLVRG